jgi:endonuclease/exonuclease/phosphatase family metal-dependent hydrolase
VKLVTWNIQCGLGCDGRVDLARIVRTARALADADIYCFQEVSRGFRSLDGGDDQPGRLAELLPGYAAVFRPAVDDVDEAGVPRQFGNMVLSRLPILRITNHVLPWPPVEGVRSMRRAALEVLIRTPLGPLRVITSHLEYHHAAHREAQVRRLREIHAEGYALDRLRFRDHSDGPYRASPPALGTVLCGDFNMGPGDAAYESMLADHASAAPALYDAWRVCKGTELHAPTTGVFDAAQWPEGPHCRDYVFVSGELIRNVQGIRVDLETDASDHQPVRLILTHEAPGSPVTSS